MRDVLAHRGPDGAGVFADERAALGHRRLSIVDLPAAPSHWPTRTSRSTSASTARSTTTPTCGRAFEAAGHRYHTAVGHRDDRPRLRTAGRRLRPAVPRHVRVRDLGRRRGGVCRSPAIASASSPALGLDVATAFFASEIKAILESGLIEARANESVLPERAGDPRHGRRGDAVPRHPQADARPRAHDGGRARSSGAGLRGRPVGAEPAATAKARAEDVRRFARCSTSPSGCG